MDRPTIGTGNEALKHAHQEAEPTARRPAPTPTPDMPPQAARLRAIFGAADPVHDLLARREAHIRVCAYYKAEKRGFTPGRELEDWLEAEREIDALERPR